MDPLHLTIALSPIAAYLLYLAGLNLWPRPTVVSGSRDSAILAAGVCGFVVAGPMELFWPEAAATAFGAYVWLLLAMLYILAAALLVLSQRPRVVIFNADSQLVRSALATVAEQLDADANWAGDALLLPNQGVQLHIDPFPSLRNVQLVANGAAQSFAGWRRLRRALAENLRPQYSGPNPYGGLLLLFGCVLTFMIARHVTAAGPALADSLWKMLRLKS